MQFNFYNDKYTVPPNHVQSQFFNILSSRIQILSRYILPQLPNPIVPSINNIPADGQCSFVAIISKHSPTRFFSLDSAFVSENDTVYLEDETGAIRISSVIPSTSFVSGMIIGISGHKRHSNSNTFQITRIYEPLQNEFPFFFLDIEYKITIISELHLNSPQFDYPTAKNFFESLSKENISLLIVIGSSFSIDETYGELSDDWDIKKELIDFSPNQMLEMLFELTPIPKIYVPGELDPTDFTWPQPPINKTLFSGLQNTHLCTNPALFDLDTIKFQVCSGLAVQDVVNQTDYSFHEAQIMLLRWRHLAPSMPELIQPHSSMIVDLLVMDEIPNFFVCGNSDSFNCTEYSGVRVVSVPSFCKTSTAVYLNLKSGDVSSQVFSRSHD